LTLQQIGDYEKDGNIIIKKILSENEVTKVLYAYQPFTRANLQNEDLLPASTFSIEFK
jgi:hypothetical protein